MIILGPPLTSTLAHLAKPCRRKSSISCWSSVPTTRGSRSGSTSQPCWSSAAGGACTTPAPVPLFAGFIVAGQHTLAVRIHHHLQAVGQGEAENRLLVGFVVGSPVAGRPARRPRPQHLDLVAGASSGAFATSAKPRMAATNASATAASRAVKSGLTGTTGPRPGSFSPCRLGTTTPCAFRTSQKCAGMSSTRTTGRMTMCST